MGGNVSKVNAEMEERRKKTGYYSRKKEPERDLTQEELINEMKKLTELGWVVFVKWTCEKCGERVICDLPNTVFTKGYEHTEKSDGTKCGCVSYPEHFGILIMGMIDPAKLK